MKKNLITLFVLFVGCLTGLCEISDKQMRDYSRVLSLDSISEKRLRQSGDNARILRVEFSGDKRRSDDLLEKIYVRIAVEITDVTTRKTYFAERTQPIGKFSHDYMGEGHLEFLIPCRTLKRITISAYAVQYGVMDGGQFTPFTEKFSGVESYENLKKRTSAAYPEKCELTRTTVVED